MDKKFSCYCGLYCENCPVMAKIEPAAKALHQEIKNANFDEVFKMIPGGEGFWAFLKGLVEDHLCISCRDGSGNPNCAVRICAKEKGVDMCALCGEYPCDTLKPFFDGYPMMKDDNDLLRDKGWDAWGKLQDERRSKGWTYSDGKK